MIPLVLPHLGSAINYSCALYPDPPSHDFCVWVIGAELVRRHYGFPAPLNVRLLLQNGQLGLADYGPISVLNEPAPAYYTKEQSDHMIANVLVPAIDMIGAVKLPDLNAPVQFAEINGYVQYDHHIRHLVDAGRQGFAPPQWQPPPWAFEEVDDFLQRARPVVITLRELDRQPERNSNLNEWMRAAAVISKDHPVLFVRDTARANEHLPAFRTYPRASFNAYIRAALYQRAHMNLMVQTGPAVWCIFSNAPYVLFKQLIPALPDWLHGQPIGWKEFDHMEPGDQYPWAKPNQRLAWADDTFENIMATYA